MNFVDDEDLVAIAGGRDSNRVDDDFAGVFDLGVGRGVYLLNIHRPGSHDIQA